MDVDALRRELTVHKNEFSDIRVFHRVHDSMVEHAMLQTYAWDITKALTGLTAGGSEYFGRQIGNMVTADIPFCVERIRQSRENLWEQLKTKIRAERTLRSRVVQLETALAAALAALERHDGVAADEIRHNAEEPTP